VNRVFANPGVLARSWYPLVRSRHVRRGRVRSVELFDRRIALYRDHAGRVRAVDARCPHLGADLGQGAVEGDNVRCAFHRWCFGPDGSCVDAPGHAAPPPRRARAYPALDRWGFVWVFNGPEPLFGLPDDDGAGWRTIALPAQRIACHPHVVLANGLDLAHYEALHGLRFSEPPRITTSEPHQVSVALRGRPRSAFWQVLSGTRRREVVARFTTIGGSLALSSVTAPVRVDVLFTGRPDRTGRCLTLTLLRFPDPVGPAWIRAIALLLMLLHDDRRVLERLDFRPQFADTDAPLRAFAETIDRLGAW
jgi:phenylpropionate dioxygenase-like ring-hydroxylating dioxygenase large terminal subunit